MQCDTKLTKRRSVYWLSTVQGTFLWLISLFNWHLFPIGARPSSCKNCWALVSNAWKVALLSPAGNWTPVSHVTGGDTDHYTTEELRKLRFFHARQFTWNMSWNVHSQARTTLFLSLCHRSKQSDTEEGPQCGSHSDHGSLWPFPCALS